MSTVAVEAINKLFNSEFNESLRPVHVSMINSLPSIARVNKGSLEEFAARACLNMAAFAEAWEFFYALLENESSWVSYNEERYG